MNCSKIIRELFLLAYLQLFQGSYLAVSFYHSFNITNHCCNDFLFPSIIRRNRHSSSNSFFQVFFNLKRFLLINIKFKRQLPDSLSTTMAGRLFSGLIKTCKAQVSSVKYRQNKHSTDCNIIKQSYL